MKRLLRDFGPLVGLWVAVGAYYLFVISAGHFTQWHAWTAFYDEQAGGLLNGHLYLLEKPSRALMALKDPYAIANMSAWRWDHSYYRGHLYVYFGIVPAFITAAAKLVVSGRLADNGLVFGFFIARLIAGTLLIRAAARRALPRPPRWAVALAMLVFALANPTPYTLARGAVYEAAIMGGVAFMIIGLCFGDRSLGRRSPLGAIVALGAASLCFGLAGGSRLSLLPVGAVLALSLAVWHWRLAPRAQPSPPIGRVTAALAPAGAVMLGLLLINRLRFDEWTEFGRRYMMTDPKLFLGVRFFAADVYAYGFAPPFGSCKFPFLSTAWDTIRASTPAWLPVSWPADLYSAEPTLGLLATAPFAWFALAAPVMAIARWRLRRATDPTVATTWITREAWLPVALAIGVAGAAPLLVMNVISMRYQHDFASFVLLIAIFAGWRLLAAPASPRGRRAVAALYVLLAIITLVIGVLLGFGGYFKHFERHNPGLLHTLERHLSFCAAR